MKTLMDVKGGCIVDDGGHWIWSGAKSRHGRSSIHAPDFTRDPSGQTLRAQMGKRAVWHIKTRRPIQALHRIYSRCRVPGCLRPACLVCETAPEYGARMRATGALRGSLRRRLVNRRNNQSRRSISDTQMAEIRAGKQTDIGLAAKFGVHRSTISRYRRGLALSVPNHFQVLIS